MQRLVPWDTGHEEFTERPGLRSLPSPPPKSNSNHLEQDLVVVFFKEIRKIVPILLLKRVELLTVLLPVRAE